MKKVIVLLMVLFSVTYSQLQNNDLELIAKQFFNVIVEKNYTEVTKFYDKTMSEKFPPMKVKEFWNQNISIYGEPVNIGDPELKTLQGYDIVYIPVHFNSVSMEVRIVFNSEAQVAGFFMVPIQQFEYELPDYADTTKFFEKDITFGSDYWQLEGTLSIPKDVKNPPLVILVHGSGKHDRNEQIGPNRPFQDIAWGLSSNGIAVFRYDKRNKAQAAHFLESLDTLTIYHESVEDAILAAKKIKTLNEFKNSNVYVLGHSQGGYVIPIINNDTEIFDGYISLAGLTGDFRETLKRQYKYLFGLDGVVDDGEKAAYQELEIEIKHLDSLSFKKYDRFDLPLDLTPVYWEFILKYDIETLIKEIKKPILVLNGSKDYQVVIDDFNRWKEFLKGNSKAEFKWYDNLNHLFMISNNEISKPSEYFETGHIENEVIIDITNWVKKNND